MRVSTAAVLFVLLAAAAHAQPVFDIAYFGQTYPNMEPSFSAYFDGQTYPSTFCGAMEQNQACVSLLTDPTVGGLPKCGLPGHREICLEMVTRVGKRNLYLRWTAHFTYDLEKNDQPTVPNLVAGGFGKFELKKDRAGTTSEFKRENRQPQGKILEQVVFQAKNGPRTPGLDADSVSAQPFTVATALDLLGFMDKAAFNPPDYAMLTNNCAEFASDLLSKVGLSVPFKYRFVAGAPSGNSNLRPVSKALNPTK